MAQSIGNIGAASAAAAQGASIGGTSNSSGLSENDSAGSSTDPKFGDVLKRLQAEYGAKPNQPRKIKKTLGKDDFLRIMITQMQNQDPTSPFKAEQMASEMAQFTSVEQMQNMNRSLKKMSRDDRPADRLAMTSLIGKTVTIDRGRFPHNQGDNESLVYTLPKNAKTVKVALVSQTGEVVLQKDIGQQKAGEHTFVWNGLKANTLPAPSGNYYLRVDAKDDGGMDLDTQAKTKAPVVGVSFAGKEPVILVGDAKHQAKVTLDNIIEIDDASGMPMAMRGAPGGTSGAMQTTSEAPNFFTFHKGVGSKALDPSKLSPEVRQALAKYENAQAPQNDQADQNQAKNSASLPHVAPPSVASSGPLGAPAGSPTPEKNVEKGFPNGLHD